MTRIELLGTSFQIQSDESPEYIDTLLTYYKSRVQEIEGSVATGDPLKKAILAALLVTDELFRERETVQTDGSGVNDELSSIADRIIGEIERVLPQE